MATIYDFAETTIANGGATWYPSKGQPVTEGIAVAVPGHERKISGKLDRTALVTELIVYIIDLIGEEVLSADLPPLAIGTWLNEADGMIYLDVVEIFSDLDSAIAEATVRGELAVFDLGTLTEHATGVTR